MGKQQFQQNMLDGSRVHEINRRLEAFDAEAKKTEDPPEGKADFRRVFEIELRSAASVVRRPGAEEADYKRTKAAYDLRKVQSEKGPGEFRPEYPNFDMPGRQY